MRTIISAIPILALLAASCGPDRAAEEAAEMRGREAALAEAARRDSAERAAAVDSIRAMRRLLDEAANRADWTGAAMMHAEDAVVMLPNRPAIEGREAILKHFAGWPAVSGGAEIVEIEPRGDLAVVRTRYRLTMKLPTGSVVTDSGKGVEVWRRQPDGRWLLSRDISSSDARRSN